MNYEYNCMVSPVSCWGGKKFVVHQDKDVIHDKVYGVNRQMCDLGKTMNDPFEPLSEGAIQEIAKALEIARNPKSIMEEKKTKKMTKAEAFEWLKCKKVNTIGLGEEVQKKLFDCGLKWRCGKSAYYNFGNFLFIDNEGLLSHCGDDEEYWKRHAFEEISAYDILSIVIIEDKKNEFVDCSEPCPEIKAVQELLRNSNGLKDKIVVITKDNVAVL